MPILRDTLASVLERGARLVDWRGSGRETPESLAILCEELLSSKGEATGVVLAARILEGYEALDIENKRAFFLRLGEDFDLDPAALREAIDDYEGGRTASALARLTRTAEPRRQEVFRRLNFAPEGTRRLVAMRADLLDLLDENAALARVDTDLHHLLGSWFNRGFLTLRPIDWNTPAAILEKIIAYEAVHEIDSWEELRRRVDPEDRRCFAFFHPSMPDEPLVFVEVALTRSTPDSIQALLAPGRERINPREATTAVFYSISNCQKGLKGVSFGAFLIKQVAADLARDHRRLETFVTLSPVPGFARWLRNQAERDPDLPVARAFRLIENGMWREDAKREAELRDLLLSLAAFYLVEARRRDGRPLDPVARFHLGNGALLLDVHWMADTSEKGMRQSFGIMVNYLYDLDRIEEYHEAYAEEGRITASRKVRGLVAQARKGGM